MNVPGWSSFSITNAVFYLKACPIGVLSLTTKWKVLPRSGQWLRFEPSGLKFFFRGKIRSLIMMSLLDIVMVRRHLLKVGVVVVVVHLLLQKCFLSSCAKIQLSSKLVHLYFKEDFSTLIKIITTCSPSDFLRIIIWLVFAQTVMTWFQRSRPQHGT